MIVCFMSHPVAGDVLGNLLLARRWLAWLQRHYPERAFIAPWIDWIETGDDDSDPAQRERGLRRDEAVAARCDEIWLVGARLSDGMKRELAAAQGAGARVRTDHLHKHPPEE